MAATVGGVDLRKLARRQRWILWCLLLVFLLSLSTWFVPMIPGPNASLLLLLAVGVIRLIVYALVAAGVFLMLAALNVHVVWRIVTLPLLIVPLVKLAVLIGVNYVATKRLREVGLSVGLLGVPDSQITQRLALHACRACGYDLTGNTSGRCPECGELTMSPSEA